MPASAQAERRLMIEMADVGSAMFAGAAALVLAALPFVADAPQVRRGWLAALAVAALLIAGGQAVAARRWRLPDWYFPLIAILGTVMVGLGSVAAGPRLVLVIGAFYVFVATYSFYYLTRPVAYGELALCGIGYAMALIFLDVDQAVAAWLVVIGTTGLASYLIAQRGQRVRELTVREHEAVVRLQELDHTRRMFMSAMGQDMRTPLSVVRGAAALIRVKVDNGEDPGPLLETLSRNAAAADEMLTDLLDLERIEHGEGRTDLEHLDLAVVVAGCLDLVDLEGRPVGVDLDEVKLRGDRRKIERVVTKLLDNVVRHTLPGTPVSIEVAPWDGGGLVTVSDAGPGVQDDDKERIFELFARGRRPDSWRDTGAGIGLAVVSRFAGLHGGRAWVEDRDGGGASFRVWFGRSGTTET